MSPELVVPWGLGRANLSPNVRAELPNLETDSDWGTQNIFWSAREEFVTHDQLRAQMQVKIDYVAPFDMSTTFSFHE